MGPCTVRPTLFEYHVQNKTFKKLIKQKKQQFVDFKINELISNENNRKFWDTLKSMNENNLSYNNNENPTNKLYDHFKMLHSAPHPNTLSAFQIHMLNDKKRLEDSNHLQSELDNPIWSVHGSANPFFKISVPC